MLDREREQAQTVAAAAVGKDLPAAEDIEVVFAEYTNDAYLHTHQHCVVASDPKSMGHLYTTVI